MQELRIMLVLPILFLGWNTITDLRTRKVSPLSLILFGAAGICLLVYEGSKYHTFFFGESLWDLLCGAGVGVLLFLVSLASAGAIGRGDALVCMVLGLYLGLWRILLVLMGGCLLCAFWGMILLAGKRANRNSRLPFLPFLLLSCLGLFLLEVSEGW